MKILNFSENVDDFLVSEFRIDKKSGSDENLICQICQIKNSITNFEILLEFSLKLAYTC